MIKPVSGSEARQLHHELDVTGQLIEQLPDCDSFFQVLDPRIDDALAFALHGFAVSARYTFRIDPQTTPDEAWKHLNSKTRNVIRSASRELTIVPDLTPREFLELYEANLAARSRDNAFGDAVMRELVNAFVERKAGMLLGAYDQGGKPVAAVGLVWDQQAMYYLLSSRSQDAHCGSISLLLWTGIGRALERKLTFDFDGFSSPDACHDNGGSGRMKTTFFSNDATLELAHITTMVSQLEQLVQSEITFPKSTVVTLPAYWRARIKDIGSASLDMQSQVRTLLARLDALEAANERH
ncbi:GNAT family N-acetyltransferase [Paraburkholderia sp. CNPSo 3076]|uniref:GNAT family N-acetyltransferase n=1 Tax=Paraburkholderia sp. CNPSo 3076 TaxID=2940936 RepID=UPI00225421B0|nr:GNAT family N-acetyltransferase [Paraburkholderia sp. CNPSo 3076]MCX5544348.1 GNAT family N-acetyltransferase [Paraburkholderia sp. CNPSo 3076]